MFEKLSNLHQKCFPNHPWSADDFRDLKNSGCEIIMSENGFIVYRIAVDEAEIITIGVNPETRRNGIASAMIGIIEKTLKNQGVKKIFLEVASNNEPAKRLYESMGFKMVGLRPKYYDGVDAILMAKDNKMNEKEIFERIQKLISELLACEKSSIKLNTNLVQELGMDSLDLVDIFYRTKREFNIVTKDGTKEDLLIEYFFQNPTPKTLLYFVKDNIKINMNKKTQALKFLQNPKSVYQR
ncbi:MAG: ribosomal protein S18-alanine N-acetyltransferase [Alphaproteobacteria bacterium]|nr:ribosomal protein S18-alanine N-acetyltransferase [Alphaproteobacteria bacterium]